MSVKVVLRKRPAHHQGEIGLFPDNEMAEGDMRLVKLWDEASIKVATRRDPDLDKFRWALATKVADAVEGLFDKEDGMALLKTKVRFVKAVHNSRTKRVEFIPKSTAKLSNEQLRRLVDRMVHVTLTEIIPGMRANDLREELTRMCAGRNKPMRKSG